MFKGKKIDKKRYLSVVGILMVVLPAIFTTAYAGRIGAYIGVGGFILIAAFAIWETITALGFNKYITVLTAAMVVPFFLLEFGNLKGIADTSEGFMNDSNQNLNFIHLAITWKPVLILVAASFIPVLTEPKVAKEKFGLFGSQIVVSFIVILAGIFFKGLWALNASGLNPVFYFLLIAIISDTFGYFGGKYFGKKLFRGAKLAPKISPKKTWAGFVIGFVFAVMFGVLFGYMLGIWTDISTKTGVNEWFISILMAFILSIMSPLGDLAFSWIKRRVGIKDFSNLLPGHGGVFDRIDAISVVTVIGIAAFIIAN